MGASDEAGADRAPAKAADQRKEYAMFDDDFDLILDADGDGDRDFFDREEAEEDFLRTESEERDDGSFDSFDCDDGDCADDAEDA